MSEMPVKTCTRCDRTLPLDNFWKDSSHSDGHQSRCKTCMSKANKRFWASDEGKRTHHNCSVRRKYGITMDEWDAMFVVQNGVCAICGQPESRTYKGSPVRLAVDHNHETGKIRQLLCCRCNTMIGLIEENVDFLHKIESYLEKNK